VATDLDGFPFGTIARDLRQGICIPFLGAGASSFPTDIAAKPPSAQALAMELAEEWQYPQYEVFQKIANSKKRADVDKRVRARLDCENLMQVSSWVEHGGLGDRLRLNEKLRACLADKPLLPNPLHKLLACAAREQPMAIITTNYDDLIELALDELKVPFDLFVVAIDRSVGGAGVRGATLFRSAQEHSGPAAQDKFEPVTGEQELLAVEMDAAGEIRLNQTVLFKIHGHIGRGRKTDDTFVITEEDYVSFLGRMGSGNSVIPADLAVLMLSRRLLFLGYGLRDWNFRVLFDRLARMRVQAITSYAIAYDIDSAERRLWDQRKVQVFSADLNKFVPLLGRAWTKAAPPG
jgi:hypothetical protein